MRNSHLPLMLLASLGLATTACASRTGTGALIGGSAGAVVGKATGLGTGVGAVAGGTAGAVIGSNSDDDDDR